MEITLVSKTEKGLEMQIKAWRRGFDIIEMFRYYEEKWFKVFIKYKLRSYEKEL